MTTSNWNVYKIFANGKRAKFPMHTFKYDDETLVFEFFTKQIEPTFTVKQKKSKYIQRGQKKFCIKNDQKCFASTSRA